MPKTSPEGDAKEQVTTSSDVEASTLVRLNTDMNEQKFKSRESPAKKLSKLDFDERNDEVSSHTAEGVGPSKGKKMTGYATTVSDEPDTQSTGTTGAQGKPNGSSKVRLNRKMHDSDCKSQKASTGYENLRHTDARKLK